MDGITRLVAGYSVDQIKCPTAIACGRAGAWCPVEQHAEIAAAIRGARLEIIEDADA